MIDRFLKAQNRDVDGFEDAKEQILNGKKTSHWIWWIFPQLDAITKGIHRSWETAYFSLANRQEAIEYWSNDTLRSRYLLLCELITNNPKSIPAIFGNDWIKVRSSLLLFQSIESNQVIENALKRLAWNN